MVTVNVGSGSGQSSMPPSACIEIVPGLVVERFSMAYFATFEDIGGKPGLDGPFLMHEHNTTFREILSRMRNDPSASIPGWYGAAPKQRVAVGKHAFDVCTEKGYPEGARKLALVAGAALGLGDGWDLYPCVVGTSPADEADPNGTSGGAVAADGVSPYGGATPDERPADGYGPDDQQ
jgi:hypothetical protein